MGFPATRMRRLRKDENFRKLIRETRLSRENFIFPLFVCPGTGVKKEIASMPGNFHFSIDKLIDECQEVHDLGIPGVILFGIPEKKDEIGSVGYSEEGIVQRAVRALKKEVPDLLIVTDVCLCEYTSHGHCGIINNGIVDNDETVTFLARQAVSHANAGADMVAPSDMMDGRVRVIRSHLDDEGFSDIPIMAYSAKYASSFYGPFREAAESAPQFGDRMGYQMDMPNAREALREVALDIEEGADIVMVKPALAYLDIICRVHDRWDVPVAAYNVSGEFSCIKAAAQMGWIDGEKVMMEVLHAIKRAGADIILTYFAKDAAKLLP